MTVLPFTSPTEGRTFLDLQDEALADDFNPSKHRANAKRFLNEAQRRIARRARVPQLENSQTITTVGGSSDVALSDSGVRINSLRNTTDRAPLEAASIEEIDDLPASSGKPSLYAINGRTITFYPTPDGAYSLSARFQGRPTDLVEDADVPQIGDDYADLLVTYARARLFRLEDDFEMARLYMQDFETDLAAYMTDVQYADRSRKRQIPGMYAAGSGMPTFVRP
jgi:hypothetical protein